MTHLQELSNSFDKLLRLTAGWYCGHGVVPRREDLERLETIIGSNLRDELIPRTSYAEPFAIYPGSVCLYWDHETYNISMLVNFCDDRTCLRICNISGHKEEFHNKLESTEGWAFVQSKLEELFENNLS